MRNTKLVLIKCLTVVYMSIVKSLLSISAKVGILTHHNLNHPQTQKTKILLSVYWQEIAASQGFAFLGRGDVEWVKYWQMPSPKTSLFTTIPMWWWFEGRQRKILANVNSWNIPIHSSVEGRRIGKISRKCNFR